MDALILMGSPRKNGNTAALLDAFVPAMTDRGWRCDTAWLYDMSISPCRACRTCQRDWTVFGCPIQDDVHTLFPRVLDARLLVLATPIYSWYCTAPMKALLDRLVYGMNKYYGRTKGPSLWAGKSVATIVTCGYPPEKGADLWQEGLKRYCRHSALEYAGMLAERHMGYDVPFMDEDKARRAAAFAEALSRRAGGGEVM